MPPQESGRGYRMWQCDHGCRFREKEGFDNPGPLRVNKDRNACLNSPRIFMGGYMLHGDRPQASLLVNIRNSVNVNGSGSDADNRRSNTDV
jgi:hypothetical protein